MVNVVVLIGRLTKDPELRYTPGSGVPVANFMLAVDRNFLNQQGQREADFIPIIVWRKQAENVGKYLKKGSQVAVSGRIQTRNWDDQDGKRHYITEVIGDRVTFLGKSTGSNNTDSQKSSNSGTSDDIGNMEGFVPVEGEDELPF